MIDDGMIELRTAPTSGRYRIQTGNCELMTDASPGPCGLPSMMMIVSHKRHDEHNVVLLYCAQISMNVSSHRIR
jgi:hypothetical protein